MLDLGWPEMLVIAIILIVVVGPKDLPKMMRAFGRTTSKIRSMAGDFRKQFDDAIKEADLDEIKNLASEARKLNPASELKKAMSPMERAAKDVKAGLDTAMNPTKPAPAAPAPGDAKAVESTRDGAAPEAGKASARPLPEAVGAKRAEAAANAARAKTAAAKPAAAKPAAAKPATAKAPAAPTKTAAPKPKPTTKSAASAGSKPAKPASATSKAGAKN